MSLTSIHNLIMKEIREEGYYHVKYYGEWMIGQYRNTGFWSLFTNDVKVWILKFNDHHFEEIDERRITREWVDFTRIVPEKDHDYIKNRPKDKLFGLL